MPRSAVVASPILEQMRVTSPPSSHTYGTRPLYPVRLQSAYGEHSANRCNSDVIGPFIEPDSSFVRLYLTHQYVFLLRKRNRGSVMGY